MTKKRKVLRFSALLGLSVLASTSAAVDLTVVNLFGSPGKTNGETCVAAAAAMGVTIVRDFSHFQCSSGSQSSDFPAYPSNAYFNLPPGATGDDVTERIQLKVFSQPATSSASECGMGNPILASTGTKIQREVDYQGSGNLPLEVIRTYSSANPLGNASDLWSWNYGNRMQLTTYAITGQAIAYYPDRRYVSFHQQTDGSWESTSGAKISLSSVGENLVLSNFEGDRVETFDQFGNLLSVEKSGSLLTFSYDEIEGQQRTTVANDYGSFIEVFHNDKGMPERIIDPAGNITWYTYGDTLAPTSTVNLVSVAYGDTSATQQSNAQVRTYHYELDTHPIAYSSRLLTGITDERGVRYATFEYESGNQTTNTNYFRAKASENSGSNRFEFIYSGSDVEVTNPLGKKTIYSYVDIDRTRKLSEIEGIPTPNCLGTTQSMTYDSNGFVSSVTDQNGNVTAMTNDGLGQPLSTTLASGDASERTIARTWHPDFRLPTQEIYPDYTVDTTYNGSGNVLSRTVTDTSTGVQRTWAYTYNNLGNMLTENGPRSDVSDVTTYTYYNCSTGAACGQLQSVTNAVGQVTTIDSYNAHGQPTSITDPNGVVTTIAYDFRRRLVSRTTDEQTVSIDYELNGNISRVTLSDNTYTDYGWDDANRLVSVNDAEGNRIEWTLDNAGNRTAEEFKNSAGSTTKTQTRIYDELSRMINLIPAHGGQSIYGYDKNNNQTTMTDADSRITIQYYDALDRLTGLQDAIQGVTSYDYDTQDNIVSVTDPENETTAYTYNGFGDQLTVTSPDTGTTTYTVDAAGNRVSDTDARGVTTNYSYDALNRLSTVTYPDSSLNITYTYDQGVNGQGRLTGITDESGTTLYGYDARGNLISVSQTIAGQTYTQTYNYNGADRPIGMSLPSGRAIAYSYDSSGRISGVTSGGEALASNINRLPFGPSASMTLGNGIARNRSYDLDYRILNIDDAGVLSRNYAIDAVDNINAITDAINPAVSQLFTYDSLDRLDFATGNYGDKSYTYDGVGNRQSLTTDLSAQGGDNTTQIYNYGSSGHRLDAISGGERAFQYDAAGNTLDNGLATFNYNDRNRMASSSANELTTTYRYNALGQRVEKNNSSGTTHYLYDLDGRLVAEADGSTGDITVEYSYLDGEPLVMWRSDTSSPPPDSSSNLLDNGDFESGIEDWLSCSDAGSTSASSDASTGSGAIAVNGADCVYQEFPITPDTTYALSCQGKTTAFGSIALTFMDTSYTSLGSDSAAVSSANYEEGSVSGTAPANSVIGAVTLYGEGASHFDSCVVESDTSTPPPPPNNVTNLLANGDFESGIGDWLSCSDAGSTSASSDASTGSGAIAVNDADCVYQEFPITPDTTYALSCQGKTTAFGSIALTFMDTGYTSLWNDFSSVSTESYAEGSVSGNAPANSAIGAVTLYGEGASHFDSCLVESDTSTPPSPPNNVTNLLDNGGFELGINNWFSCSDSGSTGTSTDSTEGSASLSVVGGDCVYQEFPITAGTSYDLSCHGKTTQYGSVALTFMDSSYASLATDSAGVSTGGFAPATLSGTVPANGAIGAITLYGEGTSLFDACSVTEGQ